MRHAWFRHFIVMGVLVVGHVGLRVQSARAADGAEGERLTVREAAGVHELRLDDVRTLRQTSATINNQALYEFSDTSTKVVTWDETGAAGDEQAYFTVARDGAAFFEPRLLNREIKLRDASFEPVRGVPAIDPALQAGADCRVRIVQFAIPPLPEMRQAVEQFGTVRAFLPHHSFVVEMDQAGAAQVAALPFVRWVGLYHPQFRVDASVREQLLKDDTAQLGGEAKRYRVKVFDETIGQQFEVADRVEALGGSVEVADDSSFLMEVTLTPAQLATVVGLDQVEFVEPWSAPRSRMNVVRLDSISGANQLESVAGYTGANVRGEVMDNGVLTTHQAFTSRITVRNGPAPVDNGGTQPHGTSTFGIVFGDGTGSANGRGMLPDAQGVFSFYGFPGSRTSNMQELSQAPFNCVFQSNSWGFADTPNYTSVSAEMDQIVFNQDILVLHSSGNSGTQSGVEHAWAKNVVAVGGVLHFNSSNPASHIWGGSGSIGPMTDGRIKPDLCHFWDSIRTTSSSGGYTSSFGGTSAACPIVAGHFGLFYEMWADGLFGNPVSGGTVFQERPHASTAKAMLINTANSYPFSGLGDDLTRTHQGWGLPNVMNIYNRRDHFLVIDETAVIEPFESASFTRTVNPALPFNDQLRATLVYTDRAGSPGAGVHRVNDLSLKVTSPSAVVYWGNNGLLTGNLSTSGGSSNTIDTVENVFIDSPEAGMWTFEVVGDEIVLDGHPETIALDADFALVIYGGEACPPPQVEAITSSTKICPGDDITLTGSASDFDTLQWVKDDVDLSGENGTSLTILGFDPSDYGDYELSATNECGETKSEVITLSEFDGMQITQQPQASLVSCVGYSAVMTVTATGDLLSYSWEKDSIPLVDGGGIVGSSTNMLTIGDVTTNSVGEYRCIVGGACGASEISTSTSLSVTGPEYLLQPVSQCVDLGATVVFEAEAVSPNGAGQFQQWFKDGVGMFDGSGVSGAFTDTLTLTSVDAGDAATYSLRTLTLGSSCVQFSDDAELTVGECCPAAGDMDNDGDFDLADVSQFAQCFGENIVANPACECANVDAGSDNIDLDDWAQLSVLLTGPQ
ncbi:MAG: S8 family serine peptidase [Phycisphaerales bacterium]|nr:S8 family serine peptidase [Phycisphaerales bacterium]